MELSVPELTFFLKGMAIILAWLTGLAVVTALIRNQLTRLTRRLAVQTDLDMIGQEARVVRTIRPGHTGRILCTINGQTTTLSAVSSQKIRPGTRVLITAIDHGVARTIVHEAAPPAPAAEPK
jgi:membrane protein implicated in regulation of membrane protease activity